MENSEITKQDDNTIAVVKTVPVSFTFTPKYLREQRQRIVDQQTKDNEQREKEIAEVDLYLAECEKLNVIEKIVEPIEVEPVVEDEVVIKTELTK
jgi:hypothetical protein